MRKVTLIVLLIAPVLLFAGCGGGSSSSSEGSTDRSTTAAGTGAKTPEQVWAKEVEGVMRRFENTSAGSVDAIHTSTSKYTLEPTYARYSDQLAELGKQLEATDPPATCRQVREEMGELARKVGDVMGVLGHQSGLSPEEFAALAYQQRYKFARVGRRLTNLTIHPHC